MTNLTKDHLTWTRGKAHLLDYGMDFYAAQTVQAADGRRIMPDPV